MRRRDFMLLLPGGAAVAVAATAALPTASAGSRAFRAAYQRAKELNVVHTRGEYARLHRASRRLADSLGIDRAKAFEDLTLAMRCSGRGRSIPMRVVTFEADGTHYL